MIRAAVLDALARASQDGSGQPQLRIDPVLKPLARRRLARALDAAMLEAPTAGDAELCRLAYTRLAGPDVAPAYRPTRWVTALAALLAAIAAAGLVLIIASSMRGRDGLRRRSPPPAGAFVTGALPAPPEATLEIFRTRVPALVIALDQLSLRLAAGDEAAVEARQAVQAAILAIEASASPAHAELVALARAADGVVTGEVRPDELLAAVGRLDDALAAAGVAVFVDGDVIQHGDGRRSVWLYCFTVESVRAWSDGKEDVRALRVRRLDRMNYQHGLLGFSRPNLREAIVLMDQAEDETLGFLLPGLVEDAPVALGDAATGKLAGQVVRRELSAPLAARWPAAQRAGRLYVQREALFDRIEKHLERMGYAMARPSQLYLPEGWLADLERFVPSPQLDELDELDEGLAGDGTWNAFGALASLLAGAIERHEVQHRLDFLAGARRMPAALEKLVGPAFTGDRENPFAVRCRNELSAYLAQLAYDDGLAGVSLVLQARLLLDEGFAGSAENHAALVIFEGLARELGLPASELVVRRRLQQENLNTLVRALLARPAPDITAAARRLWAELFGEPLPSLTLR